MIVIIVPKLREPLAGFQALCRLALGEAHLHAGRLEEAHTLAARALERARTYQEPVMQRPACRVWADTRPVRIVSAESLPTLVPAVVDGVCD